MPTVLEAAGARSGGDGPPAASALSERASARLASLPIFSAADYLALNPDVAAAGSPPLVHALAAGLSEDRRLFTEVALARAYGTAVRQAPAPAPRPGAGPGHRCSVFVHSRAEAGNREAAAALADDLAADGLEVSLRDERAEPGGGHGTPLFVAPHEFFASGLGASWDRPAILADAVLYLDAPLESVDVRNSLRTLLDARAVVDTSAVNVPIWQAAGIPTLYHRPPVALRDRWIERADLFDPLMRAAPPGARVASRDPLDWRDRPIDVLFFDRDGPVRTARLARLASSLAPHRTYVYAFQDDRGSTEDRVRRAARRRIAGHLATCARLTLHLNDGRLPSLDRRRVVEQTLACGSVVVTDTAFAASDLEPDVHYFQAAAPRLGALVDWLLLDPEGRRAAERARDRAFAYIADNNRPNGRAALLGAFVRGDGVTACP